jgi:hypothetical protein
MKASMKVGDGPRYYIGWDVNVFEYQPTADEVERIVPEAFCNGVDCGQHRDGHCRR